MNDRPLIKFCAPLIQIWELHYAFIFVKLYNLYNSVPTIQVKLRLKEGALYRKFTGYKALNISQLTSLYLLDVSLPSQSLTCCLKLSVIYS